MVKFCRNVAMLLPCLLATIMGCGSVPNPDGRMDVSGTITLNGNPVGGMAGITFAPVAEGEGGGNGQIRKGAYHLTGYDGVKPGKYIVRIFASVDFDKSTGKIADSNIIFGNEVSVDLIPAEFNRDSKIEFEVVSGRANVFNYDVKTDYVPQMPKNSKAKAAIPL